MKTSGLFLIISFCFACNVPKTPHKEAGTLPNIIFIMADDMGYGDLGCYGQTVIQTPYIDQLAAEGMRFTQCYAGSTVCAPSRSALMTGQHTGHTSVRGNASNIGGVPPEGRVPLQNEDITVAEVLKGAGYVTGMTGKWGLGEPGTAGLPNLQGFDEWFGYLNQRNAHEYYPPYLWNNQDSVVLEGNQEGKQEQYSHDLFTDFALNFVRKHQDTTFFLYLPYTIPHDKYQIPDVGRYENEKWKPNAKVYAAMIERMDADVGKLMALLKETGIDEHTIVFFCSDNGAAQRWEGIFDSSGPLRGRKRDMYEGGIRTPLIVRYPDKIAAGTTSDLIWYFPDVLPTLADLAGTQPPKQIDGVSISPTLFGKPQDFSNRYLYWEFYESGFQQAVRWGNWKAVKLTPEQPWELYDLSVNLRETNNISTQHPDVIESIEEYVRNNRTESPFWPTAINR
jgi:arylsulfatase A-like enzyme